MSSTNSMHSLNDFQRNATDFVQRLATTKRPIFLTVNGEAQVVIQDAQAYQEMVDFFETIKKVNVAASSFDSGKGRSVVEAFAELDGRIKSKYDQ